MDWSGVVADRRVRGGVRGGMIAPAREAAVRVARVRRAVGAGAFALAWGACVEGATLVGLARAAGMGVKAVQRALAHALEKVAPVYERG